MEEWKKEKGGVESRKGETDLWRKAFRWMTNTVKIGTRTPQCYSDRCCTVLWNTRNVPRRVQPMLTQ
jgi:hypothetical protein